MFDRKTSEIKQRSHGTGVGVHSSTSEVDVNDFEILLFLVAFAAFCDAFFWG